MMTAQLAEPDGNSRTSILFIDDEPRVLKSMRAMFRKDYDVHLANSGQEALEIIDAHDIRVVVSDQRMPEMTGVEVLTEIKSRSPRTVRILLTGYADLAAVEASINDAEVFKYLMKPCPADEVRGAVAEGLATLEPQHLAEVVQLEEMRPPERRREKPVGDGNVEEAAAPPVVTKKVSAPASQSDASAADVLVLSDDEAVCEGIADSTRARVHKVSSVESAVTMLSSRTVGVLVADIGAEEAQVTALVEAVRDVQPHLMIILVSDRSDASLLIRLINAGQIFRFLLKPLQPGQCKISLTSAMERYRERGDGPVFTTLAPEQSRWRRFTNWLLGISK